MHVRLFLFWNLLHVYTSIVYLRYVDGISKVSNHGAIAIKNDLQMVFVRKIVVSAINRILLRYLA